MKLKKLFALYLALAFIGAACGCGVVENSASDSVQNSAAQDENLTYELVKAEGKVVITITKNTNAARDIKFIEIMEKLQTEGKFTYQVSDGMVTAIDGVANTSTSYWMLYTDNENFSNTSWGTVEYNGKTYASAIFGAESMPATQGATYIWSYETPSW